MKVFHYAQPEDLLTIMGKPGLTGAESGLVPNRCLARFPEEAFNLRVIFAFLEPLPRSWTHNSCFPDAWEIFLRDKADRALLEIEVERKNPNIFVVDWAHRESYWQDRRRRLDPQRFQCISETASRKAYFESKILLDIYLKREAELSYSLPEVIIAERVPPERLELSREQPLLEKIFDIHKEETREELLRELSGFSLLRGWVSRKQQELVTAGGRERNF